MATRRVISLIMDESSDENCTFEITFSVLVSLEVHFL